MQQPLLYEVFIYKNHLIRFYQINDFLHYEILNMMCGDLEQTARFNSVYDTMVVTECFKSMIDYQERTIV